MAFLISLSFIISSSTTMRISDALLPKIEYILNKYSRCIWEQGSYWHSP